MKNNLRIGLEGYELLRMEDKHDLRVHVELRRKLMKHKRQNKAQCKRHAKALLGHIHWLKHSRMAPLQTLARSLKQWIEPIALMWRFSKNNAITEGFHRKMKLIQRRAYGFKNFNNYRLRVIAQCG